MVLDSKITNRLRFVLANVVDVIRLLSLIISVFVPVTLRECISTGCNGPVVPDSDYFILSLP